MPQELRRNLTDHESLRPIEGGPGAVGPEPATGGRPADMGVLLAELLARRTPLLRCAPGEGSRPPARSSCTCEPVGRHPPRLPPPPAVLRRDHRVARRR